MTDFDIRERLAATAASVNPRGPIPVAVIEREARTRRRHQRLTAAAAASMAVVVVALIGSFTWRAVQSDPDPQPPAGRTDHAEDRQTDGDRRCPPMVSTEHVNGFPESDILAVDADCATTVLVGGPTFDYYPALSQDGSMVAFVRTGENGHGTSLMVLDQPSGDLRQLAETPDTLGSPEFSPDGRSIAFWLNDDSGHPYIYTVPTNGGTAVRVTTGDVNEVWPTWSPDGHTIAFIRGHGDLVTVDVATGTETILDQAPPGLKFPFWATNSGEPILAVEPLGADQDAQDPLAEFRLVMLDPDTGALQDRSPLFEGAFVDAVYDDYGIHLATSQDLRTSEVRTLDYTFTEFQSPVTVKGEPAMVVRVTPKAETGTTPDGRTYGPEHDDSRGPDLIAVAGTPRAGYVVYEDLNPLSPQDPEQAGLWQSNVPVYRMPVYDEDGITVVGTFEMSAFESTPASPAELVNGSPPPGTTQLEVTGQLSVDEELGCTYLDTADGRRWVILPWGYHLVDTGDGSRLENADGDPVLELDAELTLHARELPGQQADIGCGTDLPPLYATSRNAGGR